MTEFRFILCYKQQKPIIVKQSPLYINAPIALAISMLAVSHGQGGCECRLYLVTVDSSGYTQY
jgi:hypothetical protein